jgi:hypothetical protein
MAQETGSNGSDRLDRIERLIEIVVNTQADISNTQADMANTQSEMQQDIKNLYRSQVVMGETLTKVAEAQKQTQENLNALILTVDEMIRGRKRE